MIATVHAEFRTDPAEVNTGRPIALVFTIRNEQGRAVRDLQIVHEKPAHLLIISEDLSEFEHLHPQQEQDGSLRATHSFPVGGVYRLYLDFAPAGGEPIVERFTLHVQGTTSSWVQRSEGAVDLRTREADGLRVALSIEKPLRAGEEAMLRFACFDVRTGRPATDLEPYLGAMAHFVIISRDGEEFLHAHSMPAHTMSGGHGHGRAASSGGHARMASGAEVIAHTRFPRAGFYKIWAQFQSRGRVITVPFVVHVDEQTDQAPETAVRSSRLR